MVSEETTPPQFAVLNCLIVEPEIDQKTLGERASLDRSNVADVVNRLVQRGLVRRVRDPLDGRRNLLRLTRHGEGVHATVAERTETMNGVILGALTPDEQTAFLTMLGRVVGSGTWLPPAEEPTERRPATA
ncbi:MarR family transcriptional regulator [Frankia sp. Cppng1_Ct_nod]|uniref:MarR family winged helix-turn-helix transcriptional regulator n=1 Tax=Frankia sp. Cppng1_Ct_nod TaxID=2897162 RepID=UPI0032EA65B9